jgi:hypothetical protein
LENIISRAGVVTIDELVSLRKSGSDESAELGGNSVRSETSGNKHFLERLLIEGLPVTRKFASFRSKFIVPFVETTRHFLFKVVSKRFKRINLDQALN